MGVRPRLYIFTVYGKGAPYPSRFTPTEHDHHDEKKVNEGKKGELTVFTVGASFARWTGAEVGLAPVWVRQAGGAPLARVTQTGVI